MFKKGAFLFVCLTFFLALHPLVCADLVVYPFSGSLNFVGNDVDTKGVIWAGDRNFTVWKSLDNGSIFQRVYELPHAAPSTSYTNPFYGMVWTVFIDSRGYIFVSGGGASNSLFRSTNDGANFAQVIYGDDPSNRTFYIAMTEDTSGNLYTVTYTVGFAFPAMLKSTNGGQNWARIGSFSVFHFHNIKYNPFNGYLYAVTGERSTFLDRCNDSEKIFRSKDFGASWSLVVDRNDSLGTVYLPMAFSGNWVYVGQDYPNKICQIHRFYDDGGNKTLQPQVVYSPPISDGFMPFISGVYFNNTLLFANCAEAQGGLTRILACADGINWNSLYTADISLSDVRWNFLTTHPKSSVFTTVKAGTSIQIKDLPLPTPTPTSMPTPVIEPSVTEPPSTPSPVATFMPVTISNKQTVTPRPELKPTATVTPTPQPSVEPHINPLNPIATPTPSATNSQVEASSSLKIDFFVQLAIIAAAICGGAVLLPVMLKKRQKS